MHHACCCCYDGCVPECNNIGCAAQETFLCCEADICFKTGSPCLCCGCCALRCVWPTTCCKTQLGRPLGDVLYLSVSDVYEGHVCETFQRALCEQQPRQTQLCCCVAGSALPPDDEVPCMVNMCFINCFPQLGICASLGSMKKGASMQFESEGSYA